MAPRKTSSSGFTLVEVLIAMAITAFVAVVAYTTLSTVITGVERTRDQAARMHEINRAFQVLSRDLRLMTNRAVRDEFGQVAPAMSGGPLARELLSFTRTGWHNTTGTPRSTLQRVAYRLEGEDLYRLAFPVLDRTPIAEPDEVLLLQQVSDIRVTFLPSLGRLDFDREGRIDRRLWEENWVQDFSQLDVERPPPAAIAVELELADIGEVERLYALPTL